MLVRSRCFPLLVNRTFNGIELAHKTVVAGGSCAVLPFYCHACVGVFARAATNPGILGRRQTFGEEAFQSLALNVAVWERAATSVGPV